MGSCDARALPAQFGLHRRNVERARTTAASSRTTAAATPAPCPLTAQHIMLRTAACETLSPPMQRPATMQVVDALRHQRTIRHVKIAARRRQDQQAVAIDEFGKDADRIVEATLLAHVVRRSGCRRASILRVSRMPSVMPKLRSFAPSQPGMKLRSASTACIAWRRPSISPRVRSAGSVPSGPRWTRFRYVRSPWSLTAPHVPASVLSDAGIRPALHGLLERLAQERREQFVFLARSSRCATRRCRPSPCRSADRPSRRR